MGRAGTSLRRLVGARTAILGPPVVVALALITRRRAGGIAAWRGGWWTPDLDRRWTSCSRSPGSCSPCSPRRSSARACSARRRVAIAYTPYVARVVRGAAVRERAREYIAAARSRACPRGRSALRHLVPNVAPLIVAQGTLLFGYAMVDLAAISFIGLGVQAPQADWGVMVATGQPGVLEGYPAESLSAGLCIVVVVVAVNLLGERLVGRNEERR